VGIDLGGTKIEGVVLDEDRRVIVRERIATESARGYAHIVSRVAELANRLRVQAPAATAIGVGTPGAVSSRSGTMKNCNTTCLNGQRLREDLEARLEMNVRLENDANCFTLAEAVGGAGRGGQLVFGVILGTGVGGGIVFGGDLWSGPQHLAGEWGHHCLDPDGPPCYCGQRGCVERLLAGPAVEQEYRERSGLAAGMPEILSRARTGEPVAQEILGRFLERFGRAVANVIDILDPGIIVLGGGLSNIDEIYTRGREAVARYVFNDELRTPIVRNQLGDSAGVIGAALLT
jgi:fructokinase